jgi:hypothetical protein
MAAEWDWERQLAYRVHMSLTYTYDQLVFVNESSFDQQCTYQTRGRSPQGRHAFKRAFFIRRKRSGDYCHNFDLSLLSLCVGGLFYQHCRAMGCLRC